MTHETSPLEVRFSEKCCFSLLLSSWIWCGNSISSHGSSLPWFCFALYLSVGNFWRMGFWSFFSAFMLQSTHFEICIRGRIPFSHSNWQMLNLILVSFPLIARQERGRGERRVFILLCTLSLGFNIFIISMVNFVVITWLSPGKFDNYPPNLS